MAKKNQKAKWAGIAATAGAVVTGTVVPLVNAIKGEESEISELRKTVNSMHDKVSVTQIDIAKTRIYIENLYEDLSDIEDQDIYLKGQVDRIDREITAINKELTKLNMATLTFHLNDGAKVDQIKELQRELLKVQAAVSAVGVL